MTDQSRTQFEQVQFAVSDYWQKVTAGEDIEAAYRELLGELTRLGAVGAARDVLADWFKAEPPYSVVQAESLLAWMKAAGWTCVRLDDEATVERVARAQFAENARSRGLEVAGDARWNVLKQEAATATAFRYARAMLAALRGAEVWTEEEVERINAEIAEEVARPSHCFETDDTVRGAE